MKKIILLFFAVLFLPFPGNIEVFSFPWSKKNDEVTNMEKVVSGSKTLANLLSSLSTSTDTFTGKNWSAEDDISILLALRTFTKNSSEFFSWVNKLISALKDKYNTLLSAIKDRESASTQKATEKAEEKISKTKEEINKIFEILLGNGIAVLIANNKTAASIFILAAKQSDFSQANIDKIRKDFSKIKNSADEVSVATKNLSDAINSVKESGGEEIEATETKISEFVTNVNTILDTITEASNYFTNLNGHEISDETLSNCSLSASDSEDSDDSDRRSASKSSKAKSSKTKSSKAKNSNKSNSSIKPKSKAKSNKKDEDEDEDEDNGDGDEKEEDEEEQDDDEE